MLTSKRSAILFLSDHLIVETLRGERITISDSRTRRRVELSLSLYKAMLQFSGGMDPLELLNGSSEDDSRRLLEAVQHLHNIGFLNTLPSLDLSATASLFARSPETLLQAPRAGEVEYPVDVAVLGVPFDLGNRTMPGARSAPNAIRTSSFTMAPYSLDQQTLQPAGWFDLGSGERLLQNVRIADWGNVAWTVGEPPEHVHERIYDAVSEVLSKALSIIILGGDHSVTYGVVRALQEKQPLVLIWLDAHTDLEPWNPLMGAHTHGSVATRLLGLSNVSRILQIGQRGMVLSSGHEDGERYARLGSVSLQNTPRDALRGWLPKGERCYISVDIDCLDPSVAPGTSTPIAGGLALPKLLDIIHLIGAHNDVVGADIVEVNPERDPTNHTASVAAEIAMRLLATATFTRTANVDAKDN